MERLEALETTNVIDISTGRTFEPRKSAQRFQLLKEARDRRDPFSREDQKRAAGNLHRLLELVEKRGVSKRSVASKAGFEGQGKIDSSKRLDPYTLPDDAGPRRVERLAKKPSKYFKFARAVAQLEKRPDDEEFYLSEIFQGCSFGTGLPIEDLEEFRWAKLRDLISKMAVSVIRDSQLVKYYTKAYQTTGRYDARSGRILNSSDPLDVIGISAGGLAGCIEHPDDLPPIPSVLLGTRQMTGPQVAKLTLSNGRQIEATFTLLLEARLALAPAYLDGAPGPMIEFRSRIDARSQTLGEIVFDNRNSDGSQENNKMSRALIENQWWDLAGGPALAHVEAEERDESGHESFAWKEISPAFLRSIFGEGAPPFEMTYRHSDDSSPSRFQSGEPGFFLNAHLISGPLKAELSEACRSCNKMLDTYRDELEIRISDAETAAQHRWSNGET